MYSRGNGYGQQSYGGQSSYAQSLANAYSASSVGGTDSSSQHSLASRHPSLLSSSQEADLATGYRSHNSVSGHYGGQYASLYGSAGGVSATQQVPSASTKGSGLSGLEGRRGYSSAVSDSPKFGSGDYVPSSTHTYGHKSDPLYSDKIADYTGIDRRHYGEQSSYTGRDLQTDPASRYTDSVGLSHQRQTDRYDRLDQSSILRQEQLLKSQSIHSTSLDGGSRPLDYLAARGGASRHLNQDLASYGRRVDVEPRGSSILNASSYNTTPASSILGAAPRRNVDDLLYSQSLTNPGYGVSLPPGRDYGSGKAALQQGTSLDAEYRALHPRIDENRRDERAGYLREFELREDERRREFLREREKEREREREREKERDRDRERERERERRRDRERMLERREKERERKRAIEIRRERTPQRPSRDPRGSSVTKEGRSLRRDSISQDASHRRHSPVKDKRREYVCKVHGSCLVDLERDYLSLDKRYPRLFVSPELSKVVVNWPKENFKLSIHTPVSFEHDFVEEENALESKDLSSNLLGHHDLSQSASGRTVWNAKIILMSGVSKSAFEVLSSAKIADDRPPHICNILRFAVLKKDRAFMTIGGPWHPIDGGDPSVDDSPLIQTALRYAKDVTQLDLGNCRQWNRFLEVQYNRFGKDGLFSHKEVTVLFVPDLSECLPSLELWRNQWLAHKKNVSDRERELSLKKERSAEKKEGSKGSDPSKDPKQGIKQEKTKASVSSGSNKKENASKDKTVSPKDAESKMDEGNLSKDVSKDEQGEPSSTPTSAGAKTGKKKIVKRIVKRKAVAKPGGGVAAAGAATNNSSSGEKPAESEDKGLVEPEGKGEVTPQPVEKKPKDKSEPNSGGTGSAASVKTAVKKKIIKRVLKRKLTPNKEATDGTTGTVTEEKKVASEAKETENAGNQVEGNSENANKVTPAASLKSPEKQVSVPKASKPESSKAVKEDKDEKKPEGKNGTGTGLEVKGEKPKGAEKDNNNTGKKGASVDEQKAKVEKKDKNGKDQQPRSRSPKEMKEKKKSEEPPRHPGLILQTKCDKRTMLYSLSLSLDSLLDYTEQDTDESTIELSLFAESMHEMLQYQMGSRLLDFLQKLRVKFVAKRNQRKRQLDVEKEAKDKDDKSSSKRQKTSEFPVKKESGTETSDATNQPDEPKTTKEDTLVQNEVKAQNDVEDEEEEDPDADPDEDPDVDPDEDPDEDPDVDPDEDPDEDPEPEGDAEMEDAEQIVASDQKDKKEAAKATSADGGKTVVAAVNEAGKDSEMKDAEPKVKQEPDSSEKVNLEAEKKKKESSSAVKEPVVNTELLQAFRFFDRNLAGFIRVEDMRLIIHTLGKFLSHRDVKDLVQSALLESNTGRDDRILYNKLVRMNL